MADLDLIGTGGPVPRIASVDALDGHKLRVTWQSGEGHVVDVRPALLSHRSFVKLRTDNGLFKSARRDEFVDAVCGTMAAPCRLPGSMTWRNPMC